MISAERKFINHTIEKEPHCGAMFRASDAVTVMAGAVANITANADDRYRYRGSGSRGKSASPSPMNKALIDHYRCPGRFIDLRLEGQLSGEEGYFRFGEGAICYGRSASGFRARLPEGTLYDVQADVATRGPSVLLPFDLAEIVNNLRLERHAKHFHLSTLSAWKQSLRSAYYVMRPYMHVNVRKRLQRAHLNGWRKRIFPRWPVDMTVEHLNERLLWYSMKAQGIDRVPFVWFWPEGARSCIVVTHDVETERGQAFCGELMDVNDSFGVKASFQLVPEERYKISETLVQAIRKRGFELNMQDLNHDGHLFRDKQEFLRRARKINSYGEFYGARGFRAAVLYRDQEWYGALDFSFDMSVPNVAHLDPQRGGCCTVMPYFIGKMLEIPLTTTQDYMLFHLLNDYSLDLWQEQTRTIVERNGLVSFLIHPDYVIEKRSRSVYLELLRFLRDLRSREQLWFALPGEVDQWWRQRSKLQVVEHDGHWRIEGPGAERARLAFAKVAGEHLEYQLDTQ